MSQAVAAPSTGDPIVTGGISANGTVLSAGNAGQKSPSRRAVLAGLAMASATPVLAQAATGGPDRSDWDRAYHEYRRLKLRMDAYYALGPFDLVNEEYEDAKRSKESDPDAFDRADAALRAEEEAQGDYYRPATDAAVTLIRIAAPDLDAVAIKIQVHKDMIAGMIDEEKMTWSCIETDLRRLAR